MLNGDLLLDRVVPSRTFTNCGVDFEGPFEIKTSKIRTQRVVKSYVCSFVYFATKATHLEVVSDLTTESFLNFSLRDLYHVADYHSIYTQVMLRTLWEQTTIDGNYISFFAIKIHRIYS